MFRQPVPLCLQGLDTGIDTTEVVPETRREKLQEVLKDVEAGNNNTVLSC